MGENRYDRAETMMSMAVIGSYSDMTDEKVGEEAAYCWGNSNAFDSSPVYEVIAEGPFKKDFDEKYGPFLLESMLNKRRARSSLRSLEKSAVPWITTRQSVIWN